MTKKYGLVGKQLSYSFSKIIHDYLIKEFKFDATYDLIETPVVVSDLLQSYDGLNVTIPYKEAVIPFLVQDNSGFGVCNTIYNKNGDLFGYNTDMAGFDLLVSKLGIEKISRVVVLGSGATCKMIQAYFKQLMDQQVEVIVVSRSGKGISYQALVDMSGDILINTTPVGMQAYMSAVPASVVAQYRGVIDLNYNPTNSKLGFLAKSQGIPFINGLHMLIKQAIVAFEIWHNVTVPLALHQTIYQHLLMRKHDKIALIGMPLSGKTTCVRQFKGIDLDDAIIAKTDTPIAELLATGTFRTLETQTLAELVIAETSLIALGGGAILNPDNMELLNNYLLVFLDTPLVELQERACRNERPLIQSAADLICLYEERRPLYERYANIVVTSTELEELLNENYGN